MPPPQANRSVSGRSHGEQAPFPSRPKCPQVPPASARIFRPGPLGAPRKGVGTQSQRPDSSPTSSYLPQCCPSHHVWLLCTRLAPRTDRLRGTEAIEVQERGCKRERKRQLNLGSQGCVWRQHGPGAGPRCLGAGPPRCARQPLCPFIGGKLESASAELHAISCAEHSAKPRTTGFFPPLWSKRTTTYRQSVTWRQGGARRALAC